MCPLGVADVLTDFNTFRNERLADKCQIGTVVLRTVNRILGSTPYSEGLAADITNAHSGMDTGRPTGRNSPAADGDGILAAHLRAVLQWDLHTSLTGRALLRVLAKVPWWIRKDPGCINWNIIRVLMCVERKDV